MSNGVEVRGEVKREDWMGNVKVKWNDKNLKW